MIETPEIVALSSDSESLSSGLVPKKDDSLASRSMVTSGSSDLHLAREPHLQPA